MSQALPEQIASGSEALPELGQLSVGTYETMVQELAPHFF